MISIRIPSGSPLDDHNQGALQPRVCPEKVEVGMILQHHSPDKCHAGPSARGNRAEPRRSGSLARLAGPLRTPCLPAELPPPPRRTPVATAPVTEEATATVLAEASTGLDDAMHGYISTHIRYITDRV